MTTPSTSQSRRSRSPLTLLTAAVPLTLLITAACSDSTSTATTPATYITADSGNTQTATVQSTLPESLTVLVTDVNNAPVSGATVTWTASEFGGVPSSSSVVTNASGFARIAWILGSTAATDSMTASIATGTGTISAIFTATATAGPAVAITPVTPTSTGTAGTIVGLQAKVIDQYNNPVPNVTVTWSLAGAGTLSNTTTTTAVNGVAAVNWTLGSGSGTVTASITVTGGATQSATFTGTGS